jgi:hypothetical protein
VKRPTALERAPLHALLPEHQEAGHGQRCRRHIFRSFFECYLDRVKGYRQLPNYERALRKRKVWLEPLFAETKVLHGLRRFRLRGLHKVNMEGLMVAAGQNLERLLNYWGVRRWPTASSLAAVIQSLWRQLIRRPAPAC